MAARILHVDATADLQTQTSALAPGFVLLGGHLAACTAAATYASKLFSFTDASHFALLVGIQALCLLAALGGILTFALAALARRPQRAPRDAPTPRRAPADAQTPAAKS